MFPYYTKFSHVPQTELLFSNNNNNIIIKYRWEWKVNQFCYWLNVFIFVQQKLSFSSLFLFSHHIHITNYIHIYRLYFLIRSSILLKDKLLTVEFVMNLRDEYLCWALCGMIFSYFCFCFLLNHLCAANVQVNGKLIWLRLFGFRYEISCDTNWNVGILLMISFVLAFHIKFNHFSLFNMSWFQLNFYSISMLISTRQPLPEENSKNIIILLP